MFSTFVPSVQRFSHSYAVKFSTFFHQFKDVPTVLPRCSNIFHQFKDFPTVLPRCYNFCSCSNLSLQLSRDVFILFPSVQRFCHSYAVMLQLVLNSSRIVPNFCCDVATFFISFRIFLQLKWCCIFFHQFSHIPTVKVMLKLFFISSRIVPHLCRDVATFFISSKKDIPQSKWYCNFESVLIFPLLKWCCNCFHQFQNCPTLMPWCCNFFQQFKKHPTVKVILQLWISSDVPTVKVMLQLFSSVQKNIPQSNWYCNFESVLIFPQLKWCWNCFSSVPKLSHTYAVMLQLFSSVQKNIPQSNWYCNFWIRSDVPTVKVMLQLAFHQFQNCPTLMPWCCNVFQQIKKTAHSQIDIAILNVFWCSHS